MESLGSLLRLTFLPSKDCSTPAWKNICLSLLPILLACFLAYAVSMGLRLQELPFWDNPSLSFNNEPLMGTHDAYGHMAGAKGIGRWKDTAMCGLLALLHSLTGLSIGTLNFWLPALFAPLAVIPMCLLCAYWGYAEAGLIAGIIGTSSFGFLLRTRLGFGDTDILTLFLPLLLATSLAWWLTPITKSRWFFFKPKPVPKNKQAKKQKTKSKKQKTHPKPQEDPSPQSQELYLSSLFVWCRALMAGFVFFVYMWFYPSGYTVALYILVSAAFVVCVLKDSVQWETVWGSLAIILAFGKLGWIALPVSGLLLAAAYLIPEQCSAKRLGLFALLFVLVLYPLLNGWSVVTKLIDPILSYAKIASPIDAGSLVDFPSVKQSIREVQNIDFSQIIFRTGIHWTVFGLGILGFLLIIWIYPPALIFCPLLLLSFLSFKLGNRFSMYGGPVIGLGFGVGCSVFLSSLHLKTHYRWMIHLALAVPVVWLVWNNAHNLRPSPIIPKAYASTLHQTKAISPVHAQLWQWWDYGFAAQYYAERYSFGDGAAHYGPYLYPLALAHSTSSPLQANQIMKYTALSQYNTIMEDKAESAKLKRSTIRSEYFSTKPLESFSQMDGQTANALIKSFATEQQDWPKDLPPLYLVVSWENMKLAYWISHFGNWDLETGKGFPGKIQRLRGRVKLNMKEGTLQTQKTNIDIKTMDVIQNKKTFHRSWPSQNDVHAVVNKLSQEIYIMDSTIYESMMTQMLIQEPEPYSQHFELVIDNFPWARVYRVK